MQFNEQARKSPRYKALDSKHKEKEKDVLENKPKWTSNKTQDGSICFTTFW